MHSTWFGVLAETGFLGLLVFISFITLLLRAAIRAANQLDTWADSQGVPPDPAVRACAQSILAGLVGTVLSGTFLTHGFTWPIYILAGLVVAISKWASENGPQAEAKEAR